MIKKNLQDTNFIWQYIILSVCNFKYFEHPDIVNCSSGAYGQIHILKQWKILSKQLHSSRAGYFVALKHIILENLTFASTTAFCVCQCKIDFSKFEWKIITKPFGFASRCRPLLQGRRNQWGRGAIASPNRFWQIP